MYLCIYQRERERESASRETERVSIEGLYIPCKETWVGDKMRCDRRVKDKLNSKPWADYSERTQFKKLKGLGLSPVRIVGQKKESNA